MGAFGGGWAIASVATAVVAVGGMWLPWFRSGEAMRNSFAAFRAAQILGIEWITPVRIIWFLLPVLVLLAIGLLPAGYPAVTSSVLAAVGLFLALGGGLFLITAGLELGSAATTISGGCTMVFSTLALGRRWQERAG